MADERVQRRLAAILAADVVGYSRLIRADEEGTLARLKSLRRDLVDPVLASHGGRIFKTMGDGLLVEFASVVDAVRSAAEVQGQMAKRNSGVPDDQRIVFRIGINLGDVVIEGDDIHGDGVNVAARLEALADPGGICISGKVYEEVRDRIDVPFEDLGEQTVKNIDRPVRIWRWAAKMLATDPKNDAVSESLAIPDKPSIAVLPFDNLSGDPEQEYFSDGITEDIITALSRIRQFFVIARNTTFTYKGQAVDVQAAAKDMGVRYVLEGSMRKAGNRVRITAQLIDGTTGRHIWAESYDRDLEDIFEVQDEITQTVVGSIEPELAEAERARAKITPLENLAAWDLYQRGMAFIYDRDKHGNSENIDSAKQLFQEVIETDPTFADAYAGLGLAYFNTLVHGLSNNRDDDKEKGLAFARLAIGLASDDALAHTALSEMHIVRREFDLAVHHGQTAVDLNPNSCWARQALGMAFVWAGKAEEALPHLEMSFRISPRDPLVGPTMVRFAEAYLQMGDFEKTLEYAEKAVRRPETQFWGNSILTAVLAKLGRPNELKLALQELLLRKPEFSLSFFKDKYPSTAPRLVEPYLDGLRLAGVPE